MSELTLQMPADPRTAACMCEWLSKAPRADPADQITQADTRLFAKLIAERDTRDELALLGLHAQEWHGLLDRHFERASGAPSPLPVILDEHAGFVAGLRALLIASASSAVDTDDARCLATIIAYACLRPDHLWRDLGLAGREEVSWMLTRYFPALVVRNVDNLRWKKFLAAQYARSQGLPAAPAPGCPGCEDYGYCFPPSR